MFLFLRQREKYRKKLLGHLPKERYNRGSIVEAVNSVEKRKFGDDLRSRLLKTQRREMKVVYVVYNIHRYINYVVSTTLGFLQNHLLSNFSYAAFPSILLQVQELLQLL